MRLSGKVALVTGAGSGIGRAAARALAGEGCAVAVADIAAENARATVESLTAPVRAIATIGDVSVADDAQRMVRQTLDAFGRLDILCNIAGGSFNSTGSVVELDEAVFDKVMDVNVKGIYLMSKYALPAMVSAGSGAVVNCASTAGLAGRRRYFAYATAKAAVIQLSRCMAVDFAPQGVRVNCICPGPVMTPLLRSHFEGSADPEAGRREYESHVPLGRIAEPDEIARTVVYLVSDEASYVAGACLTVDGGRSAW